jgi:hypothetical protein
MAEVNRKWQIRIRKMERRREKENWKIEVKALYNSITKTTTINEKIIRRIGFFEKKSTITKWRN